MCGVKIYSFRIVSSYFIGNSLCRIRRRCGSNDPDMITVRQSARFCKTCERDFDAYAGTHKKAARQDPDGPFAAAAVIVFYLYMQFMHGLLFCLLLRLSFHDVLIHAEITGQRDGLHENGIGLPVHRDLHGLNARQFTQ